MLDAASWLRPERGSDACACTASKPPGPPHRFSACPVRSRAHMQWAASLSKCDPGNLHSALAIPQRSTLRGQIPPMACHRPYGDPMRAIGTGTLICSFFPSVYYDDRRQ